MFRHAHIIKENKKTEMPSRIIFFDTETDEVKGKDETELVLKLGVACFIYRPAKQKQSEKWVNFISVNDFWRFVFDSLKEKTKTYLIAHNVAFDFRVLKGFKFMKDNGFKIKKLIFNNTTNIWTFRKDKRTICVLDNMNYFKTSLENLGMSIGLTKLKMPTNDGQLLIYCHRDVEIMIKAWDMFLSFLKDNDLGNFAKTIAGQAFNTYRHKFYQRKIYVHNWKDAINMERASYHGGRSEAFFIGRAPKQDYYLVDVNSMYTSLMKDLEYPYKIIKETNTLNFKNNCAIFKVRVKTDVPVFPLKTDKLIFPIGEFDTVLSTRELEYAIKNNLIVKFYTGYLYEKANLFKDYVNFFYDKRNQYKRTGNDAFSYLCKLFLNSLYGKFGQRVDNFVKIRNTDADDNFFHYYDIDRDRWIAERTISNEVFENDGIKSESWNSFVAIASHITADARMKLWSYIKIAGRDNVYYCDTDSLIINQQGFNNLESSLGKGLGELSIKDTSRHLIINGIKDYEFGNETIIKGIRKNAEKIDNKTFKQVKFEGMNGAIHNGRTNKMFISSTIKELSREYTKGYLLKTGRVEPFRIL